MQTPPDPDSISQRLDALEKQCLHLGDQLIHAEKRGLHSSLVDQSFQRAIRSLGRELSGTQGVSEDHFAERFSALCRWHYDHLLRTNSDTNPEVVAELDTRRLDEIPTDELEPRVLGDR